jgi:hypothetical protein
MTFWQKTNVKNSDKNCFTIIEHMFYYYPAGGEKMVEEKKKKVGAQEGNKNSRIYGFFKIGS